MRKTAKLPIAAAAIAALLGSVALTPVAVQAASAETIKQGKEIAFDRKKGNCLACHMIDDGTSPGDIGPPLLAMKARFPDREKLRTQIWNPLKANPNTRMPPFGKHKILSEQEIDAVVDYLLTL